MPRVSSKIFNCIISWSWFCTDVFPQVMKETGFENHFLLERTPRWGWPTRAGCPTRSGSSSCSPSSPPEKSQLQWRSSRNLKSCKWFDYELMMFCLTTNFQFYKFRHMVYYKNSSITFCSFGYHTNFIKSLPLSFGCHLFTIWWSSSWIFFKKLLK